MIRFHWFPAEGPAAGKPAATILMGPGWGGAGDVNKATPGLLGAISIRTLLDHGYNVLTWDPRGFGQSTGNAEVDSPDYEAKDVQQLLSWVATRPEALLDGNGDPRSGMVGGSYGGGIQYVTAAADCRVDAIVPVIAWNSLTSSLFKAGIPKLGWANLLMLGASGAHLDPVIKQGSDMAKASGTFTPDVAAFFAARGPADLVGKIKVPALIIQGTVDGLFTLDEAVRNYQLLAKSGVPLAMLWYCGGHGVCLTNEGDPALVGNAATAWLDRYVKKDGTAAAVPGFQFVDQNGKLHRADAYPSADGTPIAAHGTGTLQLVAEGGSGPATAKPSSGGVVSAAALGITPAKATNAVSVTIDAPATEAVALGAPHVKLSYQGTVAAGERPQRVFAQLVDEATGLVIGNQVTPIPVELDGQAHTVEADLEMIAQVVAPGSKITLQLVATTVTYAPPRLGGSVEFTSIDVSLPVTTATSAA